MDITRDLIQSFIVTVIITSVGYTLYLLKQKRDNDSFEAGEKFSAEIEAGDSIFDLDNTKVRIKGARHMVTKITYGDLMGRIAQKRTRITCQVQENQSVERAKRETALSTIVAMLEGASLESLLRAIDLNCLWPYVKLYDDVGDTGRIHEALCRLLGDEISCLVHKCTKSAYNDFLKTRQLILDTVGPKDLENIYRANQGAIQRIAILTVRYQGDEGVIPFNCFDEDRFRYFVERAKNDSECRRVLELLFEVMPPEFEKLILARAREKFLS